jgi:hypothetical protein
MVRIRDTELLKLKQKLSWKFKEATLYATNPYFAGRWRMFPIADFQRILSDIKGTVSRDI